MASEEKKHLSSTLVRDIYQKPTLELPKYRTLYPLITAILYTAGRVPTINMGRPFFWRHLPVPAWTIDLELRAAGNAAGSLTPPSCTPQNHSVPLITRCLNLPHVTSQCNVARDWVRYAPFCFCCDSRGRKWGPQHHRFITGPPTPPTKRQNGGLLSYIARWYISSALIQHSWCNMLIDSLFPLAANTTTHWL